MATEVVNSYNIYLDTERSISQTSKGDDVMLALSQTPITCSSNQFIRLTLQSFSMYKSFTNVNQRNNAFRISGSFGSGTAPAPTVNDREVYLEPADYATRNSLGLEFATKLSDALAYLCGVPLLAVPVPIYQPTPPYTTPGVDPPASGDTDNIIGFVIKFSLPHQISDLRVRFKISDGDIFELLGGDRIYDTDLASATSIDVDLAPNLGSGPDNTAIFVRCKYNCQLSTQQNVYLRTDVNNTNIQTESFNAGYTDDRSGANLSSSRILAKLVIDNDFINYTTGTQLEYFVNLTTKQLTFIRLFLSDSHGRQIPWNVKYVYPAPGETGAVGTLQNVSQNTLGNRSFEAVVKVDIVQNMGGQNNALKSEPPKQTVPSRFGTEPLNYLQYGESGYRDVNYSKGHL